MKRLFLLTAAFVLGLFALPKAESQCIGDISYLIDSPQPCFFVGSIDANKLECFDPFTFFLWKYTWKIRGADDGELIATYDGIAFQHTFQKFGGYEFSLEIDKDGNHLTPPEIMEFVTYTTCEPCGESSIEVKYNDCPVGYSCNIELTAKMEAENAVGLLPDAKFIVTYYPTSYELNGGVGAYDLEFPDIDVNYNPHTGLITVSEDIEVPYERGCFIPRLQFELSYNAGARDQWLDTPCQYLDIQGIKTFRCIACNDPNGDCKASVKATERGDCEPYYCVGLRGDEGNEDVESISEEAGSFQVSPNPARNNLHVELPLSNRERMIWLYDAFGKPVRTLQGTDHNDIDLADLASGMYHLLVTEEGQRVFSEKIIIAK